MQHPGIEAAVKAAPPLFAEAHDLTLRTSGGCPFAGVDLAIPRTSLFAVRGSAGAGKTSLLLTLAGRMAATSGTLKVLGYSLPAQRSKILRQVGLAEFRGLNDLPAAAPVSSAISCELAMFGRPAKASNAAAFLEKWDMPWMQRMDVRDLSAEARVKLSVALALAGGAQAVAVDDIETGLTGTQTLRLMEFLESVAHGGCEAVPGGATVLVGCLDRDVAAHADAVCNLG